MIRTGMTTKCVAYFVRVAPIFALSLPLFAFALVGFFPVQYGRMIIQAISASQVVSTFSASVRSTETRNAYS